MSDEAMSDEFRCEPCGRTFDSKLGLGVHRSFCKPGVDKLPAEAYRGGPARKPVLDPATEELRDRAIAASLERWPDADPERAKAWFYGDHELYVEVWRGHGADVVPAAELGVEVNA